MYFKLEDNYFIRIPYFKEETWRNFKTKGYSKIPILPIEKDYFLSSLILSSPEFYKNLIQYEKKDIKKKKLIENTLSNYIYRMTYKQSPYGFFSTVVSINQFKNSSNGILSNLNELRKQNSEISLSKEWYVNVVKKVQMQENVLRKLKVRKGYYISKNQKYIYRADFDLLSEYELLDFNSLIAEIIDLCTEFTNIDSIIKLGEINNLTEIEILDIIKKLLEQDILISDIHPQITKYNWGDLIDNLENTIYQEKLLRITEDIKHINKVKEFSPTCLLALTEKCKDICESSQYIVGNSIIENNNLSLLDNKDIFRNFQEIIPYLLVTFNKEVEELRVYTEEFYDQYGDNYVPFLRVMSEWNSLNYNENENSKSSNVLINKVHEALTLGTKIDLQINDFNEINETEVKFLKQILDLQIVVNICSIDNEPYINIDNGVKMRSKGSFEGRILSGKKSKVNTDDYYIVDFPYTSVDLKMNNILGESLTEDLDLHDIYVYWEDNKLNLYSKKINKKIIVRKNNMINFEYLPTFLKKLYIISNQITWTALNDETLKHAQYIPRITYKNLILKLETWKVTEKGLNYNSFINKLNYLSKVYSMPNKIILFLGDDKYPLDLSNSYDIQKSFEIYEKLEYLEIKEDNRQTYEGYSIDFILNFRNLEFKIQEKPKNSQLFLLNETPIMLGALNKQWLNFEVFVDPIEQGYILEQIYKICTEYKFFFVRYFNQEDETLRIRFKLDNEMDRTHILNILCDFFNNEINSRTITKYNLNSYERENLYFGGDANLAGLEEYFILESYFVINKILPIQNPDEKRTLIIFYILHLAKKLSYNIQPIEINRSSKDFYRIIKKKLIEFYQSTIFLDLELNISTILQNAKINGLVINDLLKKKIIHLFINRAIGYDPQEEKLIIDIVKQFTTTLNYLGEKQRK
ncbi:thiopeptide-type bacteriocin biosynthesis protein [Viridibacillus sp. NPDC096237]|uniref:thiopeptide-type bacteriocin biosynthesis protein n=1 Tax=Viridibacillus sp. NPDC096237 TaxID=3390721 RepID=UPI003CFF96D9